MKTETRTALTPLDLCTLIAHEAVSLLGADADALETAAQLREGLTIFMAAEGLTDDAGDLLTWIDREVEITKQFVDTGNDAPHLIDLDSMLPTPDAAAQLDMVWILFRTSVNQPKKQRQILLSTANTLAEMGGLEDMLLTASISSADFLTAEDLRLELDEVRTALHDDRAALERLMPNDKDYRIEDTRLYEND